MGSLVTELFYTHAMTHPLGSEFTTCLYSLPANKLQNYFRLNSKGKKRSSLSFSLCQREVLNVINSNTCVALGLDFLSHMPLEDNSYPILSCFLRNDQRGAAEHY